MHNITSSYMSNFFGDFNEHLDQLVLMVIKPDQLSYSTGPCAALASDNGQVQFQEVIMCPFGGKRVIVSVYMKRDMFPIGLGDIECFPSALGAVEIAFQRVFPSR